MLEICDYCHDKFTISDIVFDGVEFKCTKCNKKKGKKELFTIDSHKERTYNN